MSSRILFISLLIFGSSGYCQIDVDTTLTVPAPEFPHPARTVLAFHLHQNLKYKLVGHTIRFYSPRIWQDRLRIRTDFEGYRSFVPFKDGIFPGAAEFMKVNLDVDYYVQHYAWGHKAITYFMPHVGPSFSIDISKFNSSGALLFGVNPRIGIDYGLESGRLRAMVQSNFTFYLDGLWMEFQPIMNFRMFRRIYLKIALNFVEAITYGGESEFGFYPGGGLSWHPRGLGKKKKEEYLFN